MADSAVITVRVPRWLKEKMREFSYVNWSEVVRGAISRRIILEERRLAFEAIKRIKAKCKPVEMGAIDRWIRENREH